MKTIKYLIFALFLNSCNIDKSTIRDQENNAKFQKLASKYNLKVLSKDELAKQKNVKYYATIEEYEKDLKKWEEFDKKLATENEEFAKFHSELNKSGKLSYKKFFELAAKYPLVIANMQEHNGGAKENWEMKKAELIARDKK